MLVHELDGEAELDVLKIHVHRRILEAFCWRGLRDDELAIGEGQLLDIPSLQRNLVPDVDRLVLGFEPQSCAIGPPVAALAYDDPDRSQPRDFLSARIRHKHGVHVDHLVANQIEGEAVFSLHRVTEQLSAGQCNAEMRIVSHVHNWLS